MNKPDNDAIPFIGMPVTVSIGSDSYAYHIERMSKSKKTIWINQDHGVREERDRKFTLRKNGKYRMGKSYFLTLGIAITHLDPSF